MRASKGGYSDISIDLFKGGANIGAIKLSEYGEETFDMLKGPYERKTMVVSTPRGPKPLSDPYIETFNRWTVRVIYESFDHLGLDVKMTPAGSGNLYDVYELGDDASTILKSKVNQLDFSIDTRWGYIAKKNVATERDAFDLVISLCDSIRSIDKREVFSIKTGIIERFMNYEQFMIKEDGAFADMGSVIGMGNPVAPTSNSIGSGDAWPSLGVYSHLPLKKKKKRKKKNETRKTL